MLRTAIAILLAIGLTFSLAPRAFACSCVAASLSELVDRADLVVLAKVTNVEMPPGQSLRVTAAPIQVLKGQPAGPLTVHQTVFATPGDLPVVTSCDVFLPNEDYVGTTYLLFLNERSPGVYGTSVCSGTTPFYQERLSEVQAVVAGQPYWVRGYPQRSAAGGVEYVAEWSDGSYTSVPWDSPAPGLVRSYPQEAANGCTEYVAQWSTGAYTWVPFDCPSWVTYFKPDE